MIKETKQIPFKHSWIFFRMFLLHKSSDEFIINQCHLDFVVETTETESRSFRIKSQLDGTKLSYFHFYREQRIFLHSPRFRPLSQLHTQQEERKIWSGIQYRRIVWNSTRDTRWKKVLPQIKSGRIKDHPVIWYVPAHTINYIGYCTFASHPSVA